MAPDFALLFSEIAVFEAVIGEGSIPFVSIRNFFTELHSAVTSGKTVFFIKWNCLEAMICLRKIL